MNDAYSHESDSFFPWRLIFILLYVLRCLVKTSDSSYSILEYYPVHSTALCREGEVYHSVPQHQSHSFSSLSGHSHFCVSINVRHVQTLSVRWQVVCSLIIVQNRISHSPPGRLRLWPELRKGILTVSRDSLFGSRVRIDAAWRLSSPLPPAATCPLLTSLL